MLRFRIRDVRHDRTLTESLDLAVIDTYWRRRFRRSDVWAIQWKDPEAPAETPLAEWADVPALELERRRDAVTP